MKSLNQITILCLVIACGLVFNLKAQDTNVDWGTASDDQVILQAIELTTPTPVSDVPYDNVTFYSAQHSPASAQPWPPLPANIDGLDAWDIGSNIWVLDDLGLDYNTLAASQPMMAMDADGTPLYPGQPVTNTVSWDVPVHYYDYGTNLWIAQEAVSGGNFTGILSNTIPGVEYQLLSMDSLSCTQWVYQGEPLLATTNWTPWSLPYSATNNFFLNALSLQDDSGTGIPDWWWLEYFGEDTNVNGDAPDPAGDGWSDWQKYAMGTNPFTWVTPPAPSGFSVQYNSLNQTVTLSWQPSFGDVTGYTITRSLDGTQWTTTATNFVDASPITNFLPEEGDPYYSLQANYTNGNSANEYLPMFDPKTAVSGQILVANGGENLEITSPIPSGTTALQLIRSYGGYMVTNFIVPINDLSSNTLFLPESDFNQLDDSFEVEEDWYLQTVNANGDVSVPSQVSLQSWFENIQSPQPFIDGRQQLEQNVNFLYRAADYFPVWYAFDSFTYYYYSYAFSGLYDESPIADHETTGPYLDKFRPFEENYFFRNFVYSPDDVDTNNGFLQIGITGLDSTLAYTFEAETTNLVIPAILDPTMTSLISFYGQNDNLGLMIQSLGLTGGNGDYQFLNESRNYYGLPLTSVLFAYSQSGTYQTSSLTLDETNSGVSGSACVYWQYSPPNLQTVGYYFAQPWGEPLPGDGSFSVTNITSTGLVAGFGQTSVFAGYAEQTLLNGITDTNVPYAYLGQYFEPEAYQVDSNGNVTANSAGTVSPYGEFVPTTVGPAALVTMPNYSENVQGTGIVQVVKLVLDVNHDGVMDLSSTGADNTTPSTPYVFWANNNYDRFTLDADDNTFYDDDVKVDGCPYTPNTATPDCNYLNGSGQRVISCARDLQDFARLWIAGMTTNLLTALPAGCTVSLNWGDLQDPNPNNPTIDLFTAADADGGIGYLTNSDIAETQTDPLSCPYIGRLGPGSNLVLNASSFANNWAGNYFIWCGVSNGTGGLNLTIANSSGTVLAQTTIYIQIIDIKQMYERWTVGENANYPPTTNAIPSTEGLVAGETAFHYPAPQGTNTPYILYVHGWNMEQWEKDRFAESAFKRLYWQGYQGRFGEFRWPTDYGFTGSFWQALTEPNFYNDGEDQAWQSGAGLLSLLLKLNTEYPGQVYMLAHSMGNVVAGEALRQAAQQGLGQIVNTYIGSQAALPAHDYDASVTTPYLLPFNYEYPVAPLNLLGTNWGPFTPNIYLNLLTNNIAAVGRRISLYNVNDFALAMPRWGFDQIYKPAAPYLYTGSPGDPPPWNKFAMVLDDGATNSLDIVSNLDDLYTVMSYAAQSYSTALGATPISTFATANLSGGANPIWPPDPTGNNYTEHFWHSAEFRGDPWEEWNYWQTVLFSSEFGFGINSP